MPQVKISQLPEILNPAGGEETVLAYQGGNYRIKLNNLKRVVTKTDVGLSNVDNTSDLNKPISTAQQSALNQKAALSHAHVVGDVTGLQAALDAKASSAHAHDISDVTNLQITLDGKAATVHAHAVSDVTGLQAALDGKAATGHVHAAAAISDFDTAVGAVVTAQLAQGVVAGPMEW